MTTQREVSVTATICNALAAFLDGGYYTDDPRIHAVTNGKVFLISGGLLDSSTRAGNVCARLLAIPDSGDFVIISTVPTLRKPTKACKEAVERIAAASRLVDIPLVGMLEVAGRNTITIQYRVPDGE